MSSLSTTSVHVAPEVAGLTPFVTIGTHRPVLEAVDVHLAAWVARAGHVDDFRVHLATAMASWAARHGHACADLLRLAGVVAEELADRTAEADPDTRLPSLTNAGPIRPLRRGGTVLGDSLPSHRMR